MDAARYRWVVLGVGTAAQAATAAFFLGLASVTPDLRAYYDTGLAGVGALLGVTSMGLVATLLVWGTATDRFGERAVMTVGLTGAAVALGAAALVRSLPAAGALLIAAGASGASVNAASGRAVLTWFPAQRRGFAMAVRQTAVPLGTAAAGVVLPVLAARGGVPAVFVGLAAGCLAAAVASAIWIREPPDRPLVAARATATPTRAVLADRRMQRLSVAGALLVVPQFLGTGFLVELLHTGRGVPAATAAALLSLTQVLGALGRLGNGAWSDRAGRLGPLRIVSLAVAAAFAAAAVAFRGPIPLLAVVMVVATALAVSWNGLLFTAAGELAPTGRAATGMAMTNTANYVGGAVTAVAGGAVAASAGWPAMLALGTVAALGAVVALRGVDERARAATR